MHHKLFEEMTSIKCLLYAGNRPVKSNIKFVLYCYIKLKSLHIFILLLGKILGISMIVF